ncbi:MAG: hypothetical protein NTW96_24665 [Planctomycetia bacterium]|nr:hypothetical protein [Planctomycetia bacterium]
MNSDRLTDSLRHLIETIGWTIDCIQHPSSLTVEFWVAPPLTATRKQIQTMIEQLYTAPFWGSTVGNCFSTDHNCGRDYIRLRQESPLPNFPEVQPIFRT